ncbi:MAG: arylamine N-acetyltransferase [Acidobacteriia bacterium]|nr:arylamine N-acetyltransferase [Terriglobia bacterium]
MSRSLPEPYVRYLRILGISGIPSGLEGLREIVRKHVYRVPFENVSKLLLVAREGAGRFVTMAEFLDGIEHHDLGGTCYAANPLLADLLRALGYETDLIAADMIRPNVHTCLRVRVGSVPYHVDVGYGGPFREPMRLDRLPFEILEGDTRYVLRDAGSETYDMSVFSGLERVHGYVVHGPPRVREFFAGAMQDSFLPSATFRNCLRICRIFEDHSVTLLNRVLSTNRNSQTTSRELQSADELAAAFASDLQMPRCPWQEVAPAILQAVNIV